jgi:hypothetical protein
MLPLGAETITFVSQPGPVTLNNITLETALASVTPEKYQLVSHPRLHDVTLAVTPGLYYYQLNGDGTAFERQTTPTLAPFEAGVIIPTAGVARVSLSTEGTDDITGIETPAQVNAPIVSQRYYNLHGVQIVGARFIAPAHDGVYIVKTIYESGREEVVKTINNKK